MHLLTTPTSQVSISYPNSSNSISISFISSSRFSPSDRNCLSRTKNILCSKIPNPTLCSLEEQQSLKVSYLVNTCGLPEKRALMIAKYKEFEITENSDDVLEFFKNHGFSQTQVSNIVRQFPNVLRYVPERTLLPKLEFFKSIGLSRNEIIELVDAAPRIMKKSLKKTLIPSFNRLRLLIKSDERTISFIKWCPFILFEDPGADNLLMLLELAVPDSESTILLEQGSMSSGINFRRIVEELKKVGFDPSGMSYVWAIHVLRSMRKSPNWEEKVDILKNWGWSEGEFLVALKKCPNFMASSEDKIMRIMNFLINTMGMEASTIAHKPVILTRSFEKVIVPRCVIYQLLTEKGLYKKKKRMGLAGLLCLSEIDFFNQVIKTFEEEDPEILNIYKEKVMHSRVT